MAAPTTPIDQLSNRGIFADWDRGVVSDLVEACKQRTVMPGQPLWSPGDPKDAAYVLLSGRVRVSRRVQPDGQRSRQSTEPGTLLTLSSLVHRWPHSSSGTPLQPSDVLELGRPAFDRLFETAHPAAYHLVDAIAKDLVAEMRDANRRLHEVFGYPAETLRMLRRRSRDGRSQPPADPDG